jgi:Domain of unknown function (DUF4252)
MKIRVLAFLLVTATAGSLTAPAQNMPQILPAPVEKDLAARAANVTEVTLGKNMLEFAAKFMDGKKESDVATRQLIMGLDGIYVRDYEFDKPGDYSMDHVEQIRRAFETPEWSPMVRERERKTGESTDIMMKMVNGESHGLFILSAEPKELSVVLILGPIRMDDLSKINGVAGIGGMIAGPVGPFSGVQHTPKPKDKTKDKAKDKTDSKTGGVQ